MQSRKDYSQIIKHEKLLVDDLKTLDKILEKYEEEHTHISGFHEDDLVKLDRESGKFTGQQFPDFAGSTGSFISNILYAFMDLKKPDSGDDPIDVMMQETSKKQTVDLLPKSINLLIKNIKLFQMKVPETTAYELCERILPKLQSFEAEVLSFKGESNKIEESKNTESNPISIQDQKKTVNNNLQNQKNSAMPIYSTTFVFSKHVSIIGSKRNIHSNKPIKPEEEHKQNPPSTTPPKSPTNK